MEQITAPVLESAPSLKVISRNGVGTDAIDMAAASRLGITVLNAPGANAQSVAELSLTLALNALRNVPWSSAALVRASGVGSKDASWGVHGGCCWSRRHRPTDGRRLQCPWCSSHRLRPSTL